MTTIKLNIYKDKNNAHGVRIYHGGDITKEFIHFLKDNEIIKSTKIDKYNNFFWLDRKNLFEQFKKIFEIHEIYLKLKEYKNV